MTGKPEPTEERNMAVYDLSMLAGWPDTRIAAVFGVTAERVKQIISKENYRKAKAVSDFLSAKIGDK